MRGARVKADSPAAEQTRLDVDEHMLTLLGLTMPLAAPNAARRRAKALGTAGVNAYETSHDCPSFS